MRQTVNPIKSNFLMESKRLEFLHNACLRAYGVVFSVSELQKLDSTITRAIYRLNK